MAFDWSGLIPYGSAAIAVGGVVVGRWMERRQHFVTWTRETRLVAYLNLTDSMHAIWNASMVAYNDTPKTSRPQREYLESMNQTLYDAEKALSRVGLVGTENAKAVGEEWLRAYDKFTDVMVDPAAREQLRHDAGGGPLDNVDLVAGMNEIETRFHDAAREALASGKGLSVEPDTPEPKSKGLRAWLAGLRR
jgi:hypothetical protein